MIINSLEECTILSSNYLDSYFNNIYFELNSTLYTCICLQAHLSLPLSFHFSNYSSLHLPPGLIHTSLSLSLFLSPSFPKLISHNNIPHISTFNSQELHTF